MSKWREEALQKYKNECFKQTKPYQFEIAYVDTPGEQLDSVSPDSVSAAIVRFPDDTKNILNFEGITTEYLLFVCDEGIVEENIAAQMLTSVNGADIVYCDEDFITDVNANIKDVNVRIKTLRTVWRKPDYSPDTLMSFPYFGTCFAVRTEFARKVPVLKKSAEISDNIRIWDFLLRATERTNRVAHISKVLYHRDLSKLMEGIDRPEDTVITDEEIYAAYVARYEQPGYKLCREAAYRRRGLCELPVIDDTDDDKKKDIPLVSIIIPSKDNSEMLKECIRNIRVNAGKVKYEIIIVDNGSCERERKAVEEVIRGIPIGIETKYIYEPAEFNFSTMCNAGAMVAKAPFFLFLNDDVYAQCDKFLEKLLVFAQMPYIGAVGAKLLYPKNNTIQHIGVTDINKGPTHKLMTKSDDEVQYFGRNRYAWNVLAVTAACLMVQREKYFQVGGFSDKMRVGYNDVDFCVKLYENGYFNVINNECSLIHHESVSRGVDTSFNKSRRLKKERKLFYENHSWLATGYDPFYSPWLDRDTIEYKSIVVPDYQVTDFRNRVKELPKLPAKVSDWVSFNIDNCYTEWAIGEGVEDAYVFDGWALIDGCDNLGFKKYMVFIPVDDEGNMHKECVIANVCTKYRTDVKQVFPDTINVYLSGFECRVPVSALNRSKYRIGVLIKRPGKFSKDRLSVGDIYGPGRGIITDSEILSGDVREGEGEEQNSDAEPS